MRALIAAVLCAAFASATFAADEAKGPSKYTTEFIKHWGNAKELTLAVAEAMPPENYSFKPNPEEMSFGEQIAHIAQANYAYCSRVSGAKSPFAKPANYDKPTVSKLVGDSFDYCTEATRNLTEDQLNEVKGPMTIREITEGVMMHMAHHRGQIEVYLRLKNIKPPTYKF